LSLDNIYIISDNDGPGVNGAIKLAELLGVHGSHVLIPPEPFKDIRELAEHNKDQAIKWLKENIK
jgi:DNA primase